jgi:hypothetical protein
MDGAIFCGGQRTVECMAHEAALKWPEDPTYLHLDMHANSERRQSTANLQE